MAPHLIRTQSAYKDTNDMLILLHTHVCEIIDYVLCEDVC